MTTRPSIKLDRNSLPGLVAVGLFAVLAYVFAFAPFTGRSGFPRGFPESQSITENIGYLMFNLSDLATIEGEGFLVAFIAIAVILDAALEAGVFLAKRESGGALITALRTEREARTDGGQVGGGDEESSDPPGGAGTDAVETDGSLDDRGGDS